MPYTFTRRPLRAIYTDQCDYRPVSTVESGCFWDQAGVNYSSDIDGMYRAVVYDAILGVGYTCTFTAGGVFM